MTQTQTQTREITIIQALNEAMSEEMRRDERVFIMGEDIQSGVYGASGGLFNEFGGARVRDCPLSENAFMGAAVGAAAVGMRPIVESRFCFMWVAMDSLISQAAKMRYMFGGQVNLPIVYRAGMSYGGSSAAHHSDRSHPVFMNIPGFKVLFPSNSYDAKGLLKTAIRDEDPVLFCEGHHHRRNQDLRSRRGLYPTHGCCGCQKGRHGRHHRGHRRHGPQGPGRRGETQRRGYLG